MKKPSYSSTPKDDKNIKETFYTKVAGVSIGNRQKIASTLKPKERLVLIREKDNVHDINAIKICTVKGEQVGYIPRKLAFRMAKEMDRKIKYEAEVIQVVGGGRLYYGVNILITRYGQDSVTSWITEMNEEQERLRREEEYQEEMAEEYKAYLRENAEAIQEQEYDEMEQCYINYGIWK